jgi:hypothetical protein
MPIQEAMNFLNGRSPGVDPQDLLYLGAVVLLYVSPLVAIFWLFQDLVGFYFSGNAPSFDDGYPRFILRALASPRQAGAPTSPAQLRISRWVVSRSERDLYATFISNELSVELLKRKSVSASDLSVKTLFEKTSGFTDDENTVLWNNQLIDDLHARVFSIEEDTDAKMASARRNAFKKWLVSSRTSLRGERLEILYSAALNLAGRVSVPVEMESELMMASLAIHANRLRRLVLRYVKALLVTLGVAIVALILKATLVLEPASAQSSDEQARAFELALKLATNGIREPTRLTMLVLGIWAPLSVFLIRQPIRWVFMESHTTTAPNERSDPALKRYETIHGILALLSVVAAMWWILAEEDVASPNKALLAGAIGILSVAALAEFLGLRDKLRWLPKR